MQAIPEWIISEFDMSCVDEFWLNDSMADLRGGDILGVLCKMDNMVCPFFVRDNVRPLRDAGLLEKAVLDAWINVRVNSLHTGLLFQFLFGHCDQKKLRACGDSILGHGPYTLYRGCSGTGRARRVRGFSWTASFDKAKWFAERFKSLPNPTVYQVEAPKRWILAYTDERQEQEFIVRIPRDAKIKRVWKG